VLNRVRNRITSALGQLDEALQRTATAGMSWLLWPLLFAVALSVGLYSFTHPGSLPVFDTNKLPDPERRLALIWLAIAFGLVALVYVGATVIRRFKAKRWAFAETSAELNRWLVGLLALPFVATLRLASIERDSPKLTLFLVAAAASACGAMVYHWSRLTTPGGRLRLGGPDFDSGGEGGAEAASRGRLAGIFSALWVIALWAGYGYVFSRFAIANHHALNTRTTDLGYYDNIFYQSSHGHPLGCSFVKTGSHISAHFDPILIFLSPIYFIHGRAESLLVLQSVWLGSGVLPAYLLGRRLLDSRPMGLVLATMYAVYPALHGANMYEFHSLTLIAPLVLWLLYFFETGANKRYYAVLAVLLLCREDVPLLMCFVGLYAILSRRPGAARLGRNTILLSIAYFIIAKGVFMHSRGVFNAGKDAYSYDYYYDAMNPGRKDIAGLLTSLFINPIFALKTALDEPKIIFLCLVFLPFVFLPFAARAGRVMLIYGLMFTLLASRGPVFTIHFQYTVVIFPVAFALTAIALRRIEQEGRLGPAWGLEPKRLTRALLGAAFAATLLMSWKFGGLVPNQSFRGGFVPITRSLNDAQRATYAWVNEQSGSIPKTASVGTTPKMGPHVSNRMEAYFYPDRWDVDYLFIDESEFRGRDLERHKRTMAQHIFQELARRGTMAVYKRKR